MKQLTRGMINCAALILFAVGMCQAGQTNGAILEIKGTVTQVVETSTLTQTIDLVVNDGAIHSLFFQTVPPTGPNNPASNCNNTTDQVSTDAYVLQSGSPTGCDPGDLYEGNNISPHDGHFSFTQLPTSSSPGYQFDISTHYECVVGENRACSGNSLPNTNHTITSNDTGFLTVTNNGSTFTGTITLSGTSPKAANCGGVSSSSDSVTFSGDNAFSEGSVVLALAQDSSGCGGFTGILTPPEGPQLVTAGGTAHFSGPISQDIHFPLGTTALPGETINDALMFVDCAALNATLANGSPGNNPNFSGGSGVPAGAQFIPIAGGSCPVILNQCSVPTGPLPDCKDIKVKKGTLITLNSDFTSSDANQPAYLIASDLKFDWANISNRGGTSYVPGCTRPPCHGGGGTGGLNGREALADLNQQCQLLTYTFSQTAVLPGDDAQVSGTLQACPFVVGEQKLFGTLIGTATLRLEGPLQPNCGDPNQIMVLTSFPVVLWPGFHQPFSFSFDVPTNACHGTSLKVTSVISSGTVNYVVDGPAINVQ